MSRSMQRRVWNSVRSRQEARRRAGRVAIGCAVESLEQRLVYSTLTVNTLADDTSSDGSLSLREAIALIQNNGDANAALGRTLTVGEAAQVDSGTGGFGTNDTIRFDDSIAGGTITLGSMLSVSGTMTIDGGSGVTLSGGSSQATWRAFYVNSTGSLTLTNLTIDNFSDRGADGDMFTSPSDGAGGAIYVDRGSLTLSGSTLSNNSAIGGGDMGWGWGGGTGYGGAVYVYQGTLSIAGGTLDHNFAIGGDGDLGIGAGGGYGGAVYVDQGTLIVTDATLSNNSATGGSDADDNGGDGRGGAIYSSQGTLTVTGSVTLQGNTASNGDAAGGAIYNNQGTFTLSITNGTVQQNAANGGAGALSMTGGSGQGGAIYSLNGDASLTFTDSTVSGNSASGGNSFGGGTGGDAAGGFVFLNQGTLSLSNTVLSNNTVTGGGGMSFGGGASGGAVYNLQGTVSITGGSASNNTATGGDADFSSNGSGQGGVVYNDSGTLTLTDATLSNNSASGGSGSDARGGAVYSAGAAASVTVTGSVLSNNSASGGADVGPGNGAGSAYGGAIYNYSGSLDVIGSTLTGNSATGAANYDGNGGTGYGGAIMSDSGTLVITGSTLDHNTAIGGDGYAFGADGGEGSGGAVFAVASLLSVTNSTLASNSVTGGIGDLGVGGANGLERGGAIYVMDGTTDIHFSTLSSNTAAQGGRGLFVWSSGSATVGIDNSILGQADNSVTDLEFAGTVNATGSNNLIRNTGVIGIGILSNADPKLGPLQDNGGPTKTMRPAKDSPAIDAGDDSGGVVTTDQRGIARPAGAFDVGAHEVVTATLTVSDVDDEDSRDSVLSLREAFRLISGDLAYGDLTVAEQGWISGTLGDIYTIRFDSSVAGQTFYVSIDDSNPIAAPPVFTPPVIGPTAFVVSKDVTIVGLDDVGGGHISLVNDASDLRLFYVARGGELTLQNLSIQGFTAQGDYDGFGGGDGRGGAIYINGGTVTIEDSELRNNSAFGGGGGSYGGNAYGGAIYMDGGTLTLNNTTLKDNSASGGEGEDYDGGHAYGGAIFSFAGTVVLNYAFFDGNSAVGGEGGESGGAAYGGAIFSSGATITGQYVLMDQNQVTGGSGDDGDGGNAYGGGLYIQGGTFTGQFVVMMGNTAGGGTGYYDGGDAGGGAMYIDEGTVTVTTFVMDDNHVTGGAGGYFGNGGMALGGALMNSTGTATFTGGEMVGNSVAGGDSSDNDGGEALGGAIYAEGGSVSLTTVTMAENSATGGTAWDDGVSTGDAGAIFVLDGDLSINFSTISGNHGDTVRGVLFVVDGGSNQITIDNSILGEADDSLSDLVVDEEGGTAVRSGSHNLIRVTAATGIGIVSNADPRLAVLGNYGGYFQTFALLPDSPALDAGGAAGGVTEDQRGADRVYNGTADIGAFESQGYTLTVDSGSTPQSAVVGNAFGHNLKVTLTENFDDAPIPGATVTFAVNPSGSASATVGTTATTGNDGVASVSATANSHAGSYTVTASVGSGGAPAATADFALTNTVPTVAPSFTSANQVTFVAGSAGTFTITTTGTPAAALTKSGTLPAGVTFVDNGDGTATLSGTPTDLAGGVFTLTIRASNGASPDATQTFTLTVNAAGQAPTIISANRVTFTAGTAGSFLVVTNGSPLPAIHVVGTLPSGVTFVDNGDGTGTFSGTPTAPGVYPVSLSAGNSVGSDATQAFTITVNAQRPLVVASGQSTGGGGGIQIKNPDGTTKLTITETIKRKAVRLAQADMNGDGVPDVIVVSGAGGKSQVRVYDGTTGAVLDGFQAFSKAFRAGMFVATGDVNGDGTPDIIVGQGAGAKAHVQVFSGVDHSLLADFAALGNSSAGVRVAAADVNGDGYADIVAAQGAGGGNGMVKVFDGKALANGQVLVLATLSKADLGFSGGAFVATGDVDGDGTPDIIVSQASGGRPLVAAFSGADKSLITRFRMQSSSGVRVASYDHNLDGFDDIVTNTTVKGKSVVSIFSGADGSLLDSFENDKGKSFVA